MMKKIFKKGLRIILWTTVLALALFVSFIYGIGLSINQIEHECRTTGMFSTDKTTFWKCEPLRGLHIIPKKKGVDS